MTTPTQPAAIIPPLARVLLPYQGFTVTQVAVLQIIAANPGITPGEISRAVGIAPVQTARVLSALYPYGITRESDPSDRRRVRLTATDGALDLIAASGAPSVAAEVRL